MNCMSCLLIAYVPQDEVAPVRVPQMKYRNFAANITYKYKMDIRGYPPSIKFCSPSQLTSLTEVELVLASWESGTTYWHCLDNEEFDQWRKTYSIWRKRYAEAVASGRVSIESEEESGSVTNVLPGTSVSMSSFIVPGDNACILDATPPPTAITPAPTDTASTHSDVTHDVGAATPMPHDIEHSVPTCTPADSHATGDIARISADNHAVSNTAHDRAGHTPGEPSIPGAAHSPTVLIADSSPAATTTPSSKRSSASPSEHGGKRSKAAKDPFVNLGCVTDANGRPKRIECSTRKPRKKETKPRKKKATAPAGGTAAASGDTVATGGPVVSVWSLKTGKTR